MERAVDTVGTVLGLDTAICSVKNHINTNNHGASSWLSRLERRLRYCPGFEPRTDQQLFIRTFHYLILSVYYFSTQAYGP